MSDKPTVGRIVQIQHPSSDPKLRVDTEPGVTRVAAMWCAAIVTYVDDDSSIRAHVFLPSGGGISVTAREGEGVGDWRWPPRA